jgi:hypothetical protein
MFDLTNYGQKKSIINIQDLGLSAASQHSVGLFLENFLFLEFVLF